MTTIIPEPYTHLLELPVTTPDALEKAMREVYRARVAECVADAMAGVERLQSAHIEGRIGPEELEERQKGMQDLTDTLSQELYDEYQGARRALINAVSARLGREVMARAAVVGALAFAATVLALDLKRRLG